MNKNYVIMYREDRLDKYLQTLSMQKRKEFARGYGAIVSGDINRGRNIIDDILLKEKVAHYLPKGVKVYESHICGFARVLETLEMVI